MIDIIVNAHAARQLAATLRGPPDTTIARMTRYTTQRIELLLSTMAKMGSKGTQFHILIQKTKNQSRSSH